MLKKIIQGSVFALSIVPFVAIAGSYQWDTSNNININVQQSPYQSRSGNTYQYDLSNPVDRMRYSTDTSAQVRDSVSVNPTRTLDRGLGQFGGGIYDR